jgi:glycerate 2-kinase
LLTRAIGPNGVRELGQVRVLCAGKAAPAMARAIAPLLGARLTAGLVIGMSEADLPSFRSVPGSHPVPTADSERAGRAALAFAESMRPHETLLVLLSGGASALMAVPAEGLTLEDKRQTTDRLLKEGADIHALNTVRKHISDIKGGWLAARASGRSRTLAISDVVGDDLSVIASGPTVADVSTFQAALGVLQQFGGMPSFPASVVDRLRSGARGDVAETPKPNDARLALAAASVIGGRADAMHGAAERAAALGYHVVTLKGAVIGEARIASQAHWRSGLATGASPDDPLCVVSSGETTVRVTGHGKGGRNQEFALAAAGALAAFQRPAVLASIGTDGIDGPTDAAGALVDNTTLERAVSAGAGAPEPFLEDNDAYRFFDQIGDLIRTGPTGTNVGDLQIVLIGRK